MTNEQRRDVLKLILGRKQRIKQMRLLKGQQLGFDFEEVVEVGELFQEIEISLLSIKN